MAQLIIRGFLALLLAALAAWPGAAMAEQWQDRQLIRGAYADGRVWLLTYSGDLFSIAEATRRRADEDLGEPVIDICRQDGEIIAVTGERSSRSGWNLHRRSHGTWRFVGRVRQADDHLLAMDCNAGRVTLLTIQRIIELTPQGQRRVDLHFSGDFPYPQVSLTTFGTPDFLYVGINSGEWGGGLRRIDRRSGAMVTIERGECGDGPLSTSCDPVHAITAEPWRPGCIVLAVGLVHFDSSGRLTEVCGETVERFFSKDIPSAYAENDEAATTSAAFFGLVPIGGTLRAVAVDGLYRIGPGGSAEFAPFPTFRTVRGVRLSFDLPDVVLVVTRVNQRASVSLGAPMLIPR
jgi:hypothetical protein